MSKRGGKRAPVRSSKRIRAANVEISAELEAQEIPDQDVSEFPFEPENTQGLAILPDELYLLIMSYFPDPPLPRKLSDSFETDLHTARRNALLALSQTCSNTRRFCRPYIWKRIEVCYGMQLGSKILLGGKKIEERKFALELVRQLEIVTIRDPSLALYVKVLNIDIRSYSTASVLEELARCMSLFVNLHTVRLRMYYGTVEMVKTAFQPYRYPQIRTLFISHIAQPLVLQCTGLQSLCYLDKIYSQSRGGV